MKTLRLRWYLKVWFLLGVLGYGACVSTSNNLPTSHVFVGPTDVDVDQRRLGVIERYHRPRIGRRDTHDNTDVDVATPRPSPPKSTPSLR